jgi:hypothetical protein
VQLDWISVSNLTFNSEVTVPFTSNTPASVSFNFASEESPFSVSFLFLDGGGWMNVLADSTSIESFSVSLYGGGSVSVDLAVFDFSASCNVGIIFGSDPSNSQWITLTAYVLAELEVSIPLLVKAQAGATIPLTYVPESSPPSLYGSVIVWADVGIVGVNVAHYTESWPFTIEGGGGASTQAPYALSDDEADRLLSEYTSAFGA